MEIRESIRPIFCCPAAEAHFLPVVVPGQAEVLNEPLPIASRLPVDSGEATHQSRLLSAQLIAAVRLGPLPSFMVCCWPHARSKNLQRPHDNTMNRIESAMVSVLDWRATKREF